MDSQAGRQTNRQTDNILTSSLCIISPHLVTCRVSDLGTVVPWRLEQQTLTTLSSYAHSCSSKQRSLSTAPLQSVAAVLDATLPLRRPFFGHNGLTLPRICCDILLLQLLQDLWNGLPVDTIALWPIHLKGFGTRLHWFLIASKVRSMYSKAGMLPEFLPQGISRYQTTRCNIFIDTLMNAQPSQKTPHSKNGTTFKPRSTWMTRMYGGRSLCPAFRAWSSAAERLTCSEH